MELLLLTKGEFEEILLSVKREIVKEVRDAMSGATEEEWLKGSEARKMLKVGTTKLSLMVSSGCVTTRGYGSGTRYSRKSIVEYLKQC